jgi:predicted RNA-binding Zn-ribbon protein involved in translation (DUF1610 family)
VTKSKRQTATRGRRGRAGAVGPSATRDLDARADALVERVAPLLRQLQAVQEQARHLGLFPNDRDLLTCPNCGLTEDVLADGQLITNLRLGQPDTGLRFIEPMADDGPFVCPACGTRGRRARGVKLVAMGTVRRARTPESGDH